MKKKQIISIVTFAVGLVMFAVGLIFLFVRFSEEATLADGEYLVTVGSFQREDEPSVIWQFTEIGKGKLTTNNHQNDYDFIWALEDGKMKIETDWLYVLNNEYDYRLEEGGLVLTSEESGEIKFRPGGSVNSEVPQGD